MYKAKYLQPLPKTGPDTVLHLKLYDGPNWSTAGPVLHAFDYSLNNHPGTLKGTAPTFQYPGIDLPGTDEYIEVADHADFSPIRTPFSISAWVYMHNAAMFIITQKGATGSADAEWILDTGPTKKIGFALKDKDNSTVVIGRYYNTPLSENQWYHIVGTYDGGILASGIKIYLDGVCVDDRDIIAGVFATVGALGHAVWIGRGDVGIANYANGLIDDVMIHKKELSAAESLDIYNLTKWRYGR